MIRIGGGGFGNVPMKPISVLFVLLFISLAASSPDEAYGRVVKVVDGDTIDVQLQGSLLSEDLIRVRLADIDCPETRCPEACEAGKNASTYTRSWLLRAPTFFWIWTIRQAKTSMIVG